MKSPEVEKLLRSLEDPAPPPGAQERSWARLSATPRFRFRAPRWLLAGGLAAACVALWAVATSVRPGVAPARVVLLSGEVQAASGPALRAGAPLERGGLLRTGAASRAVVSLGDAQLLLAEHGEAAVFAERGSTRVKLDAGRVVISAQKRPARRALLVEAHGVQVRVVGTLFSVESARSGVEVRVFEGVVSVSDGRGARQVEQGQSWSTGEGYGVRSVLAEEALLVRALTLSATDAALRVQGEGDTDVEVDGLRLGRAPVELLAAVGVHQVRNRGGPALEVTLRERVTVAASQSGGLSVLPEEPGSVERPTATVSGAATLAGAPPKGPAARSQGAAALAPALPTATPVLGGSPSLALQVRTEDTLSEAAASGSRRMRSAAGSDWRTRVESTRAAASGGGLSEDASEPGSGRPRQARAQVENRLLSKEAPAAVSARSEGSVAATGPLSEEPPATAPSHAEATPEIPAPVRSQGVAALGPGRASVLSTATPVGGGAPSASDLEIYEGARALLAAKDALGAAREFRAYPARFPQGPLRQEARLGLIEALLAAEAWAAAAVEVDQVLAEQPLHTQREQLVLARANARRRQGQCAAALPDYEALAGTRGAIGDDALYLRAYCELQAGKAAGVLPLLRRYLEQFPAGRHRREVEGAVETLGRSP